MELLAQFILWKNKTTSTTWYLVNEGQSKTEVKTYETISSF